MRIKNFASSTPTLEAISPGGKRCIYRSRLFSRAAAILIPLAVTFSVNAAEAYITAVPTAWRLQQYINTGSNVETVWFTGSPCSNGNLSLGTVTEAEKNRFWALVLSAKLSSRAIFVYYETTNCTITSFGMDG